MNTIDKLIQESEGYIIASALALKPYKEINDFQSIFESQNQEIIAQEETNDAAAEKSKGFLRRTFEAIGKAIKALIDKIKDFFDRLTMSSEERLGLEQMEKMMRENPEFANKKITVKDYKKIIKMTDDKIAEVEKKIREVQANSKTPIDNLVDEVKDFVAGNATGTSVIVVADVALKMARSNPAVAKTIMVALNSGLMRVEELEQQLGKKETKKYVKDIEALSKEGTLRNTLTNLFRKKYTCVSDALKDSLKGLRNAAAVGALTGIGIGHKGRALRENEYTSQTLDAAGEGAIKGAKKGIFKGRQKTKKNALREGKRRGTDQYLSSH